MGDHSTATLLGQIFARLARLPDERARQIGKDLWELYRESDLDFSDDEMGCDSALEALGLAQSSGGSIVYLGDPRWKEAEVPTFDALQEAHRGYCEACSPSHACPEALAIASGDLLRMFSARAVVGKPELSVQVASRLLGIGWDEAERRLVELAMDPTSGVELRYDAMCGTSECGSTSDVTDAVVAQKGGLVEVRCTVCLETTRVEPHVVFRMETPS